MVNQPQSTISPNSVPSAVPSNVTYISGPTQGTVTIYPTGLDRR